MLNGKIDESILNPANLELLEEKLDLYQNNPGTLSPEWRSFFEALDASDLSKPAAGHPTPTPNDEPVEGQAAISRASGDLHMKVLLLLQAYRRHGHFSANVDPLELDRPERSYLRLEDHRLSESDLGKEVTAWIAGKEIRTQLRHVVARMEKTYCSSIGVEYFYIRDEERRRWMMEHLESDRHLGVLDRDVKLMIFERLHQAEAFEKFIHIRFPGKKRFSLEGGETLIPALASLIENAGQYDVRQMVLGMAHRGRLNVLANILGKDPAQIFAEFNENIGDGEDLVGDVKYHLGYSNDVQTMGGESVHLSLAFNPSHLEIINPVVMGSCRARQTRGKDVQRASNLPVLVHGDAAFAGQGVNYEVLNMANLRGYTVGGALHIVVNNQLGFTTLPEDARSTPYCTDLAKMLQAPIFHVNGNDPEACYRAILLCLEWRQKFRTDAFLDLVCYRKWGHNETDEPSFTQPTIYKKIKQLKSSFELYEEQLLNEGFSKDKLDAIKQKNQHRLEEAYQRVQNNSVKIELEALAGQWKGLTKAGEDQQYASPSTAVAREQLELIAETVTSVPESFSVHPKLRKLLDNRRSMVFEPEGKLDWGMAETLAYGSLLLEGISIRLSGQDVKRGTFSHRHAALFNYDTGEEYVPLQSIHPEANFEVINSLLSEEGCLGYEFGYSLADPHTLVIWEAQFGDFVNGAQVIIDQFISSCEAKWNRMTGITLLLPHGYEGQGPEHSSARLERFLQLCSQNNIQVCNLTTPAQVFHALRRQMKRNYRKPLVIMSPKSLLRHPEAVSTLAELSDGEFQEIIDERDPEIRPEDAERLLLCTGKIYYELVAERRKRGIKNIAIATVEQLYLYPVQEMSALLQKYERAAEVCWVQEEPRNQGAWIYMENRLASQIGAEQELKYFGRMPSPSPATGYFKVHQREQAEIIDLALKTRKAALQS